MRQRQRIQRENHHHYRPLTVAVLASALWLHASCGVLCRHTTSSRGGGVTQPIKLLSRTFSAVSPSQQVLSNQNYYHNPQTTIDLLPRFKSSLQQRILLDIRGGSSSSQSSKKKKKRKGTRTPTTTKTNSSTSVLNTTLETTSSTLRDIHQTNKKQINAVLKETDAATALGDAIRNRADALRQQQDNWTLPVDPSLDSLSYSLGSSDFSSVRSAEASSSSSSSSSSEPSRDDDLMDHRGDSLSGGVEIAPSAVVANYFLKSHGGAHALQSLCSVLSAASGVGSILLLSSRRTPALSLALMKRCLVFGLTKHVAGLFAASVITARAIPKVGFFTARSWMQQLAKDPVSQYCFYTALILMWVPHSTYTWWQSYPIFTTLLLGPVLLREVISTALVACDVLVLLSIGNDPNERVTTSTRLLQWTAAVVNACFSILVTPAVWRSATALQRQQLLAKLVQKFSLAIEVSVGALLIVDAFISVLELLFLPYHPPPYPLSTPLPPPKVTNVIKRCTCTHLYVQFLLTRRKKIMKLASQVRGGAAHIPDYLLSVLLDPPNAMGLTMDQNRGATGNGDGDRKDATNQDASWLDYIAVALDLKR